MREIKFRTWLAHQEEMITDFSFFINNGKMIADVGKDYTDVEIDNDVIVMQYTGLKDKNGKDIYEGDIIESDGSMNFSNYDSDKGSKREIYCMGSGFTGVRVNNEFDKSHFSSAHNWNNYTLFNIQGSVTVIGNIYENPELL